MLLLLLSFHSLRLQTGGVNLLATSWLMMFVAATAICEGKRQLWEKIPQICQNIVRGISFHILTTQ